MSRKIIGITVGTTLPKPNFNQTDPTKGDYIKNKPDFDGLQNEVSTIHNLVGDTSVSEQITMATSELPTKNELEQSIFEKADTVRNAEGTTITLNNSAKAPIQGLKLFGKTTQDGTPTPDAPVPLVSAGDGGSLGVTVAGKNLLELGTYEITGAPRIELNNPIPAGKYMFSVTVNSTDTDSNESQIAFWYDVTETIGVSRWATRNSRYTTSITLEKPCTHIRLYAGNNFPSSSGDTAIFENMQFEVSEVATEYEPYKEQQTLTISTPTGLPGIPVTSGGNYTDETGQQWVCDEVDFGRGVYVQRLDTVDMGTLEWFGGNDYDANKKIYRYRHNSLNVEKGTSRKIPLMTSYGYTSKSNGESFAWWDNAIYIANGTLYVHDSATTATDFVEKVSGCVLLYPIATPIETPLSAEELAAYAVLHTNYPNTTILNDGGAGMEVKYCTPLTSVPMVHGEADSGKILAIDEHGCVAKINSEQFGAIDVDFDISNEGEANLLNADTLNGKIESDLSVAKSINSDRLGGVLAEEYALSQEVNSKFNTMSESISNISNLKPKAGFIYPLAASVVPKGFLLCDGAEYLRTEYPELFAAIGTMYGEGDGSTTFNVPNLQAKVPVGKGEGYELGDVGGEAEHTLTVDEMSEHKHTVPEQRLRNGQNGDYQNFSTGGSLKGWAVQPASANNQGTATMYISAHDTDNIGGSQPHNNMQPYTVVNYIIATGKNTGVSVQDIITGVNALPLDVEYGGTGATSAEMARKNLEITPENIGALSMELIWENASPDSVFIEQDVVISGLQNYNAWIVVFSPLAGAKPMFTNFVMKTTSIRLFAVSNGATYDRGSSISGNTISFWNGFYNGTEDAKYTVPTHIYGIKGGI